MKSEGRTARNVVNLVVSALFFRNAMLGMTLYRLAVKSVACIAFTRLSISKKENSP